MVEVGARQFFNSNSNQTAAPWIIWVNLRRAHDDRGLRRTLGLGLLGLLAPGHTGLVL